MNKLEALEKTLYNMLNDIYEYSWIDVNKCNCGILARTLLGGKSATSCGFCDSPKQGAVGHFSANALCMTTNLPLPKVFQVLKDAGFTHEDLINLEYYGNEKIAEKLGYKIEYRPSGGPFGYTTVELDDKEVFIKYLEAWIEILKEEESAKAITPPIPEVKERIKYIPVPESLSQQARTALLQEELVS